MRFRQVLAESDPQLPAYDENAWARSLDYAKRKPSQSLETFRRIRAENYELLKDMDPSAFDRKGVHSQRGAMTLLQLLHMYTEHAESHAKQVREVRAAFKEMKKASAT
jgi:hypothetical protein